MAEIENKYQRAAAIWVASQFNLKDADKVSDVSFINYVGGYGYCSYETLGISFNYNGKYNERELGYYGITPGEFIEQAVEILNEMEG